MKTAGDKHIAHAADPVRIARIAGLLYLVTIHAGIFAEVFVNGRLMSAETQLRRRQIS